MYPNFLKLKTKSWWSSDTNLSIYFKELKGIPTVEVCEYNKYPCSKAIYILISTESENIVFFDTPKGRFTIGIANGGSEIYLSPLGIFLYPYEEAKLMNEQSIDINSKDTTMRVISE